MEIPLQVVADAQAGAARAGYPDVWPVLVAIAMPETGGRADAIGDAGRSFGYLQFFTAGGLGDGHDPAELLDGVANMALGARYIGGRLAGGATLYDALQPWSTRDAALALFGRIQAEGIDGAIGGPPAGGAATGRSALPLLVVAGIVLVVVLS